MARGINKVILVGNLGADPDTRYMPSGGAVTNLSIATSESWKDKQTGEQKEATEWHKVVMFGRLAEHHYLQQLRFFSLKVGQQAQCLQRVIGDGLGLVQ